MVKRVKRSISVFLFALVLLGAFELFQFLSVRADDDCVIVHADVLYQQTEARSVLDMINELRTGNDAWYWNIDNSDIVRLNNLKPFVYDYELEKVAMQRVAELAISQHSERPNKKGCYSAFPAEYLEDGIIGECTAGWKSTNVVDAFNSCCENENDYYLQSNRRNLLSEDFSSVGIGFACINGDYYLAIELSSSTKKTTPTEALNERVDVSIEISRSYFNAHSVSYEITPSCIYLTVGESMDVSDITIESVVYFYGNGFPISSESLSEANMISYNPSIAKITQGKIIGKSTFVVHTDKTQKTLLNRIKGR